MGYRKGGQITARFSCGFVVYYPTGRAPSPEEIAALEEEAVFFHQDHCEPGCDGS